MNPIEAFTALKAAVNNMDERFLAEFHDRVAGMEAALEAHTKELEDRKVELVEVKAELAKTEAALKSKVAILNDERARALMDLNDKITHAQDRLVDLERQIRQKQDAHDAVIASMGSLVKRLDLGQ